MWFTVEYGYHMERVGMKATDKRGERCLVGRSTTFQMLSINIENDPTFCKASQRNYVISSNDTVTLSRLCCLSRENLTQSKKKKKKEKEGGRKKKGKIKSENNKESPGKNFT